MKLLRVLQCVTHYKQYLAFPTIFCYPNVIVDFWPLSLHLGGVLVYAILLRNQLNQKLKLMVEAHDMLYNLIRPLTRKPVNSCHTGF